MSRYILFLLIALTVTSCGKRERRPPHWQEPTRVKQVRPMSPEQIKCMKDECYDIAEFTPTPKKSRKKQRHLARKDKKNKSKAPKKKKETIRERLGKAEPFEKCYDEVEGQTITEVIYEYTPELKYEKRLILDDAYAVKRDGKYSVRLDFHSMAIHDIEETRMLMVDVVEGLLKKLNENPTTLAQNGGKPFVARNLEIYVKFESYFIYDNDCAYMGFVFLRGGILNYYAGDAYADVAECWHEHSESYKQAHTIVMAQRRGEEKYREENPRPLSAYDREFVELELESR